MPVNLTAEAQYFEDLYHQACCLTDAHTEEATDDVSTGEMVYSDYYDGVGLQYDNHEDGRACNVVADEEDYYDNSSSDDGLWSWCISVYLYAFC